MPSPSKRRDRDIMKLMMTDYKVETIDDSTSEFFVNFNGPANDVVITNRAQRGEIERFARLKRSQKRENLESVMEREDGDLITRNRSGPVRTGANASASGSGGSAIKRFGMRAGGGSFEVVPRELGRQRESSSLEMDDINITVRDPHLKRKADATDVRSGKSVKVDGGSRRSGAVTERSGGRPGPILRSRAEIDLSGLDLETFKARLGQSAATGSPSSTVKVKVPTKVSGKSVLGQEDLDRNLVYVDDHGKKRTVKRSDCSYKSAKVATCLLESIALDGDQCDLDTKDLAENLRLMDLAQCLLVSGYHKLKEIAQIAESEKGVIDKLKDELRNIQVIQEAEKREFNDMKKKYRDVCLEKAALDNDLVELRTELKTVTAYAKHCKEVARKARDAHDALDRDYVELEKMYYALKDEHERGALGAPELSVPEDACDVPALGTYSLEMVESRPEQVVS